MSVRAAVDVLNALTLLVYLVLFLWLWMNRGKWEEWLIGRPTSEQQPQAKHCGPTRPKSGS